ncbi:CR-type domain-containing protein [Psidium guajava]|nr:CR-type domain-containing protein [Psidium guajava]
MLLYKLTRIPYYDMVSRRSCVILQASYWPPLADSQSMVRGRVRLFEC